MKRAFDFTVSLISLIVLSPLFLIISLVILIDDGGPVIFRQYRVGKGNKLFYIYKFRTMKNDTGNIATSELKNSEEYITRSGHFLRKTSIDELPQLINVLRGEMSIVGPRPLIPEEKEIRVMREKLGVFNVLPGITGLAQVNGRDTIDDKEKAQLDKQYVDNFGIKQDIKILFSTVFAVLSRKDIIEGSENVNKR